MWKAVITMFIATIFISIGDGLLSKGLRELDKIVLSGTVWQNFIDRISLGIRNPIILLGVVCHATFFFMLLLAFSWADVSIVFPVSAFSYVFVVFIAKFYLQEDVNYLRWIGSLIITIGVFIVLMGEGKKTEAEKMPETITIEKTIR